MFDIITFGSATRDVILKSEGFEEIKEEKIFLNKKGVCFNLGAKIPISDIEFLSGGGGTNTAFTFKNQGFKVAYCGFVGNDYAGSEIKKELERKKISTEFLFFTKEKNTNYSVIISTKNDRTALVYKGASEELRISNIPWKKLKTKWFYIAPLSGKLSYVFRSILNFAKRKNIKTVINPGNTQLSRPKSQLRKILNMADILILNQEEASLATGLAYNKEKEIFKTLDKWVEGIVIMTKGPLGSVVSDGRFLYEAGAISVKKVIDTTGCGDAFGSGFLSGLIKKIKKNITFSDNIIQKITPSDIEYAIQFGSANAASCIKKVGAKNGLLKRNDSVWKEGKVKIRKTKL